MTTANTATPTPKAIAPARCTRCGGRKAHPLAGCRTCPVRVTLTPLGWRLAGQAQAA